MIRKLTTSKYLEDIINSDVWYPEFKQESSDCKQLLDKLLIGIALDGDERFKLSQEDLESLCVQLNNVAETLKIRLDIVMAERDGYRKLVKTDSEEVEEN